MGQSTEMAGGGAVQEDAKNVLVITAPAPLVRVVEWARMPQNAALLGIVLLAAILRFWDLDERAVHHDESLHGYYSWLLSEGGAYLHNPLLHGTVQFIATSVVFRIFGASDTTLRLLPALAGTVVVFLPYALFRHRLGTYGALIASFLLAVSPSMVYFSRFARNDIYIVLITLLLFWTMWRYIEAPRMRYLGIMAAVLGVGFATKEITYLIVLIPLIYLAFAHIGDARRLIRTPLREWPPAAAFGLVLTSLVLPLGAAGVALIQNIPGIHLANPDSGVTPATGAIAHLPGPVGAPISQGPGVVSWVLERIGDVPLIGANLADLNQIQNPSAATLGGIQSLDIAVLIVAALFGIGATLGILWNRREWLVIALVFWFLLAALFTTVFTNGVGLGSGVWQSLGYWVAQQEVGRGSQPWYYYVLILGTYEFLPLAAATVTGWFIVRRRPGLLNFDVFLVAWLALALSLLMLAGEKMPWLSIHLTLPIILLAARGLGAYAPRAVQALSELGSEADARRVGHAVLVGALVVLLLLTVRSTLRASFANGDVPVEMLVYTQTSPALAQAADEIVKYGASTGEGTGVPLTIDTAHGFGWPWHWYLREYTNVEFRCMGTVSVCGAGSGPITSETAPRGTIMALNVVNEGNIQGGIDGLDAENKVRIPLRWWFPEHVYRGEDYFAGLSPLSIAQGAVDPGAWSSIWNYWSGREPPDRLGSSDIYMYFPVGYDTELATPPDPVHGPA